MIAYLALLGAQATLIVRPMDVFESLAGLQLFLPFIAVAMFLSLPNLLHQIKPQTLLQQPLNLCVLGVLACCGLSLIQYGLIGWAITAVIMFAKLAGYYFVLTAVLTTPAKLRGFLIVTAIAATVMVTLSIRDFRAFNAEWLTRADLWEEYEKDRKREALGEPKVIRHVLERHGVTQEGDPVVFFRMRGFGVFSDPNDIALLIVISCILLLYFMKEPDLQQYWPAWLGMMAVLLYGLWCTQSRGGLLAAMTAFMVWCFMNYGRQVAITLGLMIGGMAPIVLGRLGAMTLASGTGQDRIQLWAEGLDAMKGRAAVFGIGQGQYADMTSEQLVAHNSYVHAFTELGLVGGTFFVGLAFFSVYGFWRLRDRKWEIQDRTVYSLLPIVPAIVAGWCVGMGSLSRCYTPATYLVFGIASSYLNLAGWSLKWPRPVVRLNRFVAPRWAAASFSVLFGAYMFVRLFARFG